MTFDEFLAHRLDGLLRYATTLTCDPHQAQDIVQEVVLRAQQRWGRIGQVEQPGAYVTKMVTNEFLSWRRRRRDISIAPQAMGQLGAATADHASRVDDRQVLLAGIAQLPRKQRAAVVLRYYLNRTDDQIADELGCSIGTVRSHVSRAVATLRAGLTSIERVEEVR
ncbi:SigE family RNA polymerase sigma factor [Actinokineospora globicatena]|uniref:SigE family RNA polymerase sigma factor n=1 Tax=Actinokineospora globicatena TaxID=103729 RepID=UPI0020A5982D|nr:SigE family RNA polymerase sigma factor [Actinokineospora globicatena]MCP2302165.1 RNA polymerase sigma-70 factor, sigma-E family [Actinokineospora globicatena]GLW76174.1 RNA polymerase sigma24 factor [Actinokineospora globicatena]GLW83010.1 RNA polymerase sigma24 factor [Actinokineospora globicatena]